MAEEGINLDQIKQGAEELASKAVAAAKDIDVQAKFDAAKQGFQNLLDKTDLDEKAAEGIKGILDKTDLDDKAIAGIKGILDKTDLDEKATEYAKKAMGALSAAVASFKENMAADDAPAEEAAAEEAPAEEAAAEEAPAEGGCCCCGGGE